MRQLPSGSPHNCEEEYRQYSTQRNHNLTEINADNIQIFFEKALDLGSGQESQTLDLAASENSKSISMLNSPHRCHSLHDTIHKNILGLLSAYLDPHQFTKIRTRPLQKHSSVNKMKRKYGRFKRKTVFIGRLGQSRPFKSCSRKAIFVRQQNL